MCECVGVCVCVTQLNYKRITYLKCLSFYGWKQVVSLRLEKGPSMLLLFTPVDSHWRECVATAKKLSKKRGRVFENDVFIENTRLGRGSKRRTKIYART